MSIGRSYEVEYRLIRNLEVQLARSGGRTTLRVSGSIMESAKMFQALRGKLERDTIFITILSCLPIWDRAGSPDFSVTHDLRLDPGAYRISYLGPRRATTFIKQVELD